RERSVQSISFRQLPAVLRFEPFGLACSRSWLLTSLIRRTTASHPPRFHLEVQLSRAPGANSCSPKKFTATHSRRLLMSWRRSLAATFSDCGATSRSGIVGRGSDWWPFVHKRIEIGCFIYRDSAGTGPSLRGKL